LNGSTFKVEIYNVGRAGF